MNNSLELHLKHKYNVKVAKNSATGQLTVTFPTNVFRSLNQLNVNYMLEDNSLIISNNGKPTKFVGPGYCLRPLVLANMLQLMDLYDIDPQLIFYYIDDELVQNLGNGVLSLLHHKDSNDEKFIRQELGVITVMTRIMSGDLNIKETVEELNIQEGVDVLFLLLEEGV